MSREVQASSLCRKFISIILIHLKSVWKVHLKVDFHMGFNSSLKYDIFHLLVIQIVHWNICHIRPFLQKPGCECHPQRIHMLRILGECLLWREVRTIDLWLKWNWEIPWNSVKSTPQLIDLTKYLFFKRDYVKFRISILLRAGFFAKIPWIWRYFNESFAMK